MDQPKIESFINQKTLNTTKQKRYTNVIEDCVDFVGDEGLEIKPTVQIKSDLKQNLNQVELKSEVGLLVINDPKYDIIKDSPFNEGQSVPFKFVCLTLDCVDEFSGQNSKESKKDVISKMFRSILQNKPRELIKAYYFCILKLAPDYQRWELGIGQGILVKAISKVSGRTEKQIREDLNKLGDLGLVVEKSKSSQTTVEKFFVKKNASAIEKLLTMTEVYDTLLKMAATKGQDSANEKERILEGLLRKSKPQEAKYIVRFIEANHKIGAAEKTMQQSLAKAFYLFSIQDKDNKRTNDFGVDDFEAYINRALCECPNYGLVVDSLQQIGRNIDRLIEICHIQPGIPCKPMLAKPMKSIQMIFHRFEGMKFTCEYKYDGLRGQIHYDQGKVSIFSRNLENMTEAYPDICNFLLNYVQSQNTINSFIIDSEIVAFDSKSLKILPFQVLSTRARRNVESSNIEVKVCLFLFDLLYLNGISYLSDPLVERREKLKTFFKPIEGQLQYAESMDSDSFEEIEEFLQSSLKLGCEGLMIKTLEQNAMYEPAKRSLNWLKLKKDYLDSGLGDTFDLVPIAALKGAGKRKGLYGSYLLACYNDELEIYEPICKIGTGFSDDALEKFYNQMQDYIIKQPLEEYKCENVIMDVWFKPSQVWEVKGADIQLSPIYTACRTYLNGNKGVGLRFPRLIKFRQDKRPEDATTSSFIFDIYQQQAVVKNQNNINEADDDYY